MSEDKAKASATNGLPSKRLKHRSPNYPAIGLEKALERAKAIQAQARHHPLSITAALNIWKYKQGAGNQTVAALKSFGLIDVKGEKESRQLRLTDMAIRILGNAPDRPELLKQAALKPSIHKEIWEKYDGDLPADSIIREYLRWDRNFNEESVDGFIAQFKGTIEFANLKISDKIRTDQDEDRQDDDDNDENDLGKETGMSTFHAPATGILRKQPPGASGHKDFALHLTNNRQGILRVPAQMTRKDYELLKKQIDLHMSIIDDTSVIENGNQSEEKE